MSMEAIKKILFIFCIITLSATVFNVIYFLGTKIIFERNSDYIVQGLAAFMGAFFAFLFFIFERLIDKQFSRSKSHKNAMIKLEGYLHEAIEINGDNIYLLSGFIDHLQEPSFSANIFIRVDFTKDVISDLQNVDLINDVFRLVINVHKYNESLISLRRWYDERRNLSYVDGKLDIDRYKSNIVDIISDARSLKDTLESMDCELIEILAKVRVLLTIFNNKTMVGIIFKFVSPTSRYPSKDDKWYKKELENVLRQRSEIKRNQ